MGDDDVVVEDEEVVDGGELCGVEAGVGVGVVELLPFPVEEGL